MSDWQEELERLLVALECGTLDDAQRTRLNEILREHDEALDIVASSLEVEVVRSPSSLAQLLAPSLALAVPRTQSFALEVAIPKVEVA